MRSIFLRSGGGLSRKGKKKQRGVVFMRVLFLFKRQADERTAVHQSAPHRSGNGKSHWLLCLRKARPLVERLSGRSEQWRRREKPQRSGPVARPPGVRQGKLWDGPAYGSWIYGLRVQSPWLRRWVSASPSQVRRLQLGAWGKVPQSSAVPSSEIGGLWPGSALRRRWLLWEIQSRPLRLQLLRRSSHVLRAASSAPSPDPVKDPHHRKPFQTAASTSNVIRRRVFCSRPQPRPSGAGFHSGLHLRANAPVARDGLQQLLRCPSAQRSLRVTLFNLLKAVVPRWERKNEFILISEGTR